MLSTYWFILVLVFFLIYVLTDGYDLGVGILTLFEKDKKKKHEIIELVANVWDANETWLVMTGVALWGGFPMIYGSVLQFIYPVVFTMLFGLILRGFSTEMISARGANVPQRWNLAFGIGSLVAAAMQGLALGSLVNKMVLETKLNGLQTNASPFGSWFSWYSVLFMFLVIAAYLAVGFAYLKFHQIDWPKTGRRGAIVSVITVLLLLVALFTQQYTDAPMNFNDPWRIVAFISLFVVAVIGAIMAVFNFINQKKTFAAQAYPMIGLIIAAVSAALMFAAVHYPVIVPGGVTEQAASSDNNTYQFYLVGVGMWLPLMFYFVYFVHRSLIKKGKDGLWSLISSNEKEEK
jgi:cytochrome d ubiquinol oxidase subunit II